MHCLTFCFLGKDLTRQTINELPHLEPYCTTNFLTLKSVNSTMDALQKLISNHFTTLSSLSSSYKKESKLLQESLTQVKISFCIEE